MAVQGVRGNTVFGMPGEEEDERGAFWGAPDPQSLCSKLRDSQNESSGPGSVRTALAQGERG